MNEGLKEVKQYRCNETLSHHYFVDKSNKIQGMYITYEEDGTIQNCGFSLNETFQGVVRHNTTKKFKTYQLGIHNGIEIKFNYGNKL